MFVIWLIPTQFFQLILYKFIALGFLGWNPLIFGLLPKFGPYIYMCVCVCARAQCIHIKDHQKNKNYILTVLHIANLKIQDKVTLTKPYQLERMLQILKKTFLKYIYTYIYIYIYMCVCVCVCVCINHQHLIIFSIIYIYICTC